MADHREENEDDELLIFAEDTSDTVDDERIQQKLWKVLIVDDEESIHQVTHLLLDHFEFEGIGLLMISAYSGEEAKVKLKENPDIAVILLDVVMGNDESGLQLVQFIREELKNHMIRIILRTGQPGQAPEKKVIVNYDINDYKLKTELTADKIYVTMVTALRSYHDLLTLDSHKKTLERTIDATARLYSNRKVSDFVGDINVQFQSVLIGDDNKDNTLMSALTLNIIDGEYMVYSALGEFEGREGRLTSDFLPSSSMELIRFAHKYETHKCDSTHFAGFLRDDKGEGALFYVQLSRQLNDWDKNMIEIFYVTVNTAYANLQLTQDVESTQRELIYALGEVAEARSQETGHHVKRVSEYARLFGKLLELEPGEVELLAMASPVHDIGKLTIPDAILNKPGKLTEEEFEVIKTHSQAGYEILKNSNRKILKATALIARQHHEKWNGEGYPAKLKGEEIHIFGRILALCDVFDALASERVYKKAWPMDEVVSYIASQSGQQFDPMIVNVFIKNQDQFLEIKKSFP